jgi:nucleotide-binding universal stress UspA family protein
VERQHVWSLHDSRTRPSDRRDVRSSSHPGALRNALHASVTGAQGVRDPFLASPGFPAGAISELPGAMQVPKVILVPTDFSDRATAALDYAVELAAKLDARVCVMNVVTAQLVGAEYGFAMTTPMMDRTCAVQQERLDQLVAARAGKAPFLPCVLTTGDPRAEIEQVAHRVGADLIVMGTHGRRGVPRMILGSVAEAVMRIAPCPVLLVREVVS